MFLTEYYSKYLKIVGTTLVSLESVFQYESNNRNFVQYNKKQFAQLLWLNFV
jgi:hypothetical protein